MESAPEAIFIQAHKCFAYLNAATLRLFGATSKDQLLGRPILERGHADDRAAVTERSRYVNEEREPNPSAELRYLRLDGSAVDVEVSAVPFLHGQEPGALVFVRDISARKQVEWQLRETERRTTALLNASTEPIMLLDRQGIILVANEAMARRIGKPAAALPGQHGPDFLPTDVAQGRVARMEQVFQSGQPLRFEDERDGRYFDNQLYPVLDKDGKATAVAVYSNEITERKLAVLALQQANAELERRVAGRTAELQQANAVLEKQAAQLRELASDLTLAEQRERQRVAGVLHDDLQQLLISARFHLEVLKDVRNKSARQAAAQVEALLVQSIECSRTLSGELSPPILQTGGLLPALEWLASLDESEFENNFNGSPDGQPRQLPAKNIRKDAVIKYRKEALAETANRLFVTPVHPAGNMPGTIHKTPFASTGNDPAAQADIIHHFRPDGFITTRPVIGGAPEQHELADGDGKQRPMQFLHQADGDECENAPADNGYQQTFTPRDHLFAREGCHQIGVFGNKR